MLLADREAIEELMRSFDLKEDEIAGFFRDHDVDPAGVIHYGLLLAAAGAKTGDSTVKMMIAMFASGVTVGLHLADERNKQEPLARLRLLRPDEGKEQA